MLLPKKPVLIMNQCTVSKKALSGLVSAGIKVKAIERSTFASDKDIETMFMMDVKTNGHNNR